MLPSFSADVVRSDMGSIDATELQPIQSVIRLGMHMSSPPAALIQLAPTSTASWLPMLSSDVIRSDAAVTEIPHDHPKRAVAKTSVRYYS